MTKGPFLQNLPAAIGSMKSVVSNGVEGGFIMEDTSQGINGLGAQRTTFVCS